MSTTLSEPVMEEYAPWRNRQGYMDLTAYQALANLQRASFGFRPLTYMCSPYSGDVTANIALAREFCAFAVDCYRIPLAPHLLYPQFMDDSDPQVRDLAMFFYRVLLGKCKAIWVYTPRVSRGMRTEIEWACQLDIPITYFDEHFQEVDIHA